MMKSLHYYWVLFIDYISVSALFHEWHEDERAADQQISGTEGSPTNANAEVILVLAISSLLYLILKPHFIGFILEYFFWVAKYMDERS
jgi:hypothetical protein